MATATAITATGRRRSRRRRNRTARRLPQRDSLLHLLRAEAREHPAGLRRRLPEPAAVRGVRLQARAAAGRLQPDRRDRQGHNGSGVTVAITDAFVSPTLYSDAVEYAKRTRRARSSGGGASSRRSSTARSPRPEECEASGWSGEQTLDVEAVHAMAPGAKVLYVGGKNCTVVPLQRGPGSGRRPPGRHRDQLLEQRSRRRRSGNPEVAGSVQPRAADGSRHRGGRAVLLRRRRRQLHRLRRSSSRRSRGRAPTRPRSAAPASRSAPRTTASARSAGRPASAPSAPKNWRNLAEPLCDPSEVGQWLPPAPGEYDYGGGGGTTNQYAEPWYQATGGARGTRREGRDRRAEPRRAGHLDGG